MKPELRTVKPLISVMILSYNYGELLKKALEACRRQSFSNFEIIMVNNGSTDNTENVFLKFQEENPEIPSTYILINPNKGPASAWNEALKHVNGVYVMFHDADDWMEPNCLEKLAKTALETGADWVTGAYQEVAPDGTILRVRGFTKNPPRVPTVMLQGSVFRYAVIVEHELTIPEKAGYAYDIWFTAAFAASESSSAVVNEVVYNYYFNPSSMIGTLLLSAPMNGNAASVAALSLYDGWKRTHDIRIRTELEYIGIRHYFSTVMYRYVYLSSEKATEHYCKVRTVLKKFFPNYQKNKLIWPFHNGYEFAGSFACAVLCLLDRLHMMWLIAIPAKIFKHSKMFRTN